MCMAQPARMQILMGLGIQEACVCHLESILGISQASISQHLMILRKNGLVVSRRDGRHIYYSLKEPSLLEIFRQTAKLNGIDLQLGEKTTFVTIASCPCPICSPNNDPKLICKKTKVERI